MPPDYRECWSLRGRSYRPGKPLAGEFDNLVGWVRKLQPQRILDVGCGWGRIFLLLKKHGLVRDYVMCDFVDSMCQGCLATTGILPDLWDGFTLPYKTDSFDLALSYAVLQHVPPSNVQREVSELARVSKKYIIVGCWEHGDWPGLFKHDYGKLFKTCRLQTICIHSFKSKGKKRKSHWLLQKIR